ncbi:polysaccharide deacetylase family protein [Helicobacter saguini]|uniref:Polysaccharide deacetylase n=2 Tax=Helicobacter saguini TaxID=1548018 RepID=A0A347W790_9HELI|nr:polysaccharide deacetylase family protein [Helicobacter saguini]MWV67585.1 polysaccharide deacetylase family protein [Helicobacter saguini]MWV69936.1 polysaccharide deacetylase family protein [Helicobacter saguini]MWV72849.1 polysaccharide deacetylase family protein [Helicobacter saguini]TLD92400.1 polysaccharide deacetylase [Helicobacter saguini]
MQKYKDKKPKIWAENPQGSINTAADLEQDFKDSKRQDSKILQDFKNLDSKDSNQDSNTKNPALESKFSPQDSINNHNPTQNLDSKNHNNLSQKIIYLTLDACGGEYDSKLIDFLIQNNIKATLFINARWIKKHESDFLKLAKNPLFSLQNHGTTHKPLSVNGARIYGIQGTKNIQEVFDEINENDKIMTRLSGKKPRYFRSGTAFYDDVAMDIARDMGYKIAGFSVVGDGGATFGLQKILKIGAKVKNGDILIYHFNKPQSSTRVGLEQLIDSWIKQGFTFGLLE